MQSQDREMIIILNKKKYECRFRQPYDPRSSDGKNFERRICPKDWYKWHMDNKTGENQYNSGPPYYPYDDSVWTISKSLGNILSKSRKFNALNIDNNISGYWMFLDDRGIAFNEESDLIKLIFLFGDK